MTEQRELKLALDFEGTTNKGVLELAYEKGIKVLYAHANLDAAEHVENRQSEVIHDIQFSNMRIETHREAGELAGSPTIRESFTLSVPSITMPSHLIGLGTHVPGVLCQDSISSSLNISHDVDQKTLNRVAGCQGWTKENLADGYTRMAKDAYTIKVQDKQKESLNPVLRAYLSVNGMKYDAVAHKVGTGIDGVTKEELEVYKDKATKWMDEIHTSSLALRDLRVLVTANSPNAGDKRIKVSGTVTITYSTLETAKIPRALKKSTKKKLASKKLASKKLSHKGKRHYVDDEESSSYSSDENDSYSSDDGHSDSSDDGMRRKHVSSAILKKKSDKKASRSARVM